MHTATNLRKQNHARRFMRARAWLASGNHTRYATGRFIGVWLLISFFFFVMLYGAGLMPQSVREFGDSVIGVLVSAGELIEDGNTALSAAPYTGPKLIIPVIGMRTPVVFPTSTDLDILNNELTKGVVHYPGSALPGENGNVFLFGHSTGFKVVHNKAYEVFNRLHELNKGDIIRFRYDQQEYWYQVSSVRIAKASEALVDFNTTKRMLTLSTCRIFGAKEDRYVVEAEFVKSYPLSSIASSAGA